jgi:hypothetical protein
MWGLTRKDPRRLVNKYYAKRLGIIRLETLDHKLYWVIVLKHD